MTYPPYCGILCKREIEVGGSMLDERYIVAKSKSLVWAKFQDYSSGELKILDTYLSRINPKDPDSSLVSFTKKEYAELMGLDADIRTGQLKQYTGGLLSNVVTIDLPEKGYVQYPLFSEAKCYRDDKTGQVTIEVDCNPKLKDAFFDIARNGYVRYQLKNIISLKSQYSVRLYPKLKDRPFGWTVPLEELREMLGATASSYDVFKDFNKHVLQKAIKEINEITDINVTAEKVRKGRLVAAIRFTVEEKKQLLLDNFTATFQLSSAAAPLATLLLMLLNVAPDITRSPVLKVTEATFFPTPVTSGSLKTTPLSMTTLPLTLKGKVFPALVPA